MLMLFKVIAQSSQGFKDVDSGWFKSNKLLNTITKSIGRVNYTIFGGPKYDAMDYENYRTYLADTRKREKDFYSLIKSDKLQEASQKTQDNIVKAILTQPSSLKNWLNGSERIDPMQIAAYVNIAVLSNQVEALMILISTFKSQIQKSATLQALISIRLVKENLDQRYLAKFVQDFDLTYRNPDAMIAIWSRYCTFDPFDFIRYYISVPFPEPKKGELNLFYFYDQKARRKKPDFYRNAFLVQMYKNAKDPCKANLKLISRGNIDPKSYKALSYILWKTSFIQNSEFVDACKNYKEVKLLFASWYDPNNEDPAYKKHVSEAFASGLNSLLEVTIDTNSNLSSDLVKTFKHKEYSIWNYEIPFRTAAMILRTVRPSILDNSINHPLFQSSVVFNMLRYFYIVRMSSFPVMNSNICEPGEDAMKEILAFHFDLIKNPWNQLKIHEREDLMAFIADLYFGVHTDVIEPIGKPLPPMEHLNKILSKFY